MPVKSLIRLFESDLNLLLVACSKIRFLTSPSCYLLLKHRAEFYQTCYITFPHGKGVREQHYFSVRACVRPSSARCLSHYLLLNHWAEFNQNLLHHFPLILRLCDDKIIFPCLPPWVRRPSICPSRYVLLNHWAEFNQTCFITSPHGEGVQKQHYFFQCVRPSSVYLSVTLSPPTPLGEI